MNTGERKSFRKSIKNNLLQLATELENKGICYDTGPIQKAANSIKEFKEKSNHYWFYNIEGLKFKNADVDDIYPDSVKTFDIVLTVNVVGKYRDEQNLVDPLKKLSVEVEIQGENKNGEYLKNFWHFDKHLKSKDDNMYLSHPAYHFHIGGDELEKIEIGDILHCDSPRIAHPPLEGSLAIDFIISNYFKSSWNELSQEDPYKRIIQEAQTFFWMPYALATAKEWKTKMAFNNWDTRDVWPQII